MNETPLKHCPLCKSKVERLISGGGGIIFKGSGFYINDYARSEDYKKKTKEEKSSRLPGSTAETEKIKKHQSSANDERAEKTPSPEKKPSTSTK